VASRSGVRLRLDAERLPALPGALELARDGVRTGGDRRNREYAGPHVSCKGVSDELVALAYDAQTAGGLLVTLPAEQGVVLEAEFRSRDLFVRRVGSVATGSGVVLA
jgi:selenide,water dikinase